jgi:hypothetical protein
MQPGMQQQDSSPPPSSSTAASCRDHEFANKGMGATNSGIFTACLEYMVPKVRGQSSPLACALEAQVQSCALLSCMLLLACSADRQRTVWCMRSLPWHAMLMLRAPAVFRC